MASPKTPDGLTQPSPKLVPPRPTAPPKSATRPSPVRPGSGDGNNDPTGAVEAALDATRRTSTSLSSLLDALGRFTAGVNGAQEASEQLKHELLMLREMLGQANEERLALKVRVKSLEHDLEEARVEGEQENRYIQDEQDKFIAALMEEYEAEIERLRGTDENDAHASARERREAEEAVAAAKADRERARSLAQRAQRQRDAAQQEVTRLQQQLAATQSKLNEVSSRYDDQHTRPTEPPPKDDFDTAQMLRQKRADRDTDPAPRAPIVQVGDVKPQSRPLDLSDFEDWEATETPAPPPSYAEVLRAESSVPPRPSAPPIELEAALTGHSRPSSNALLNHGSNPERQRTSSPAPTEPPQIVTNMQPSSVFPDPYRVDTKPPLKRKPDHSQRPLVGYSKSAEEIEPEQLGGSSRSTTKQRDLR